MKIHKTLKFKLTFWYSLLLSFFCIVFVVTINIWLTRYMEQPIGIGRGRRAEERALIHESRMEDLENIRLFSKYSVLPLIFLSFSGGYFLATVMLKPLEKLNREIKIKETTNLGDLITFVDNGDEISELIKSFNLMSLKLSKAFKSQKQFVENASHEIKTPLSIIQANLDMVLDNKEISKDELEKFLENSKKQISLMDNLTEDLLLLSHMTSSVEFKMEDVDLNDFIQNTIDLLGEQSEKKKIKIVFKNKGNDFKIKGNRALLERALSNIVENSIKYSNGDKIQIFTKANKENIKIIIQDNGKGISPEEKEKIFDRFYRIDKGRSRKEGGSGLGLAIVKEIMLRHGGKVFLDPGYTNGAKFVLTLPKYLF